ncbi:hypothetical protein Tco_1149184 [Tanacetum coccineum]
MEIILDEDEVAIDAIPLAIKSPSIVDWKIHKEGRKSYYQIIRADGKSQMYMIFSHMLKSFDREDLETLVSKHDVYSTKRIIAVTKVKVMKWYDYGYLEEIEVQREDQKHYKFKEGNFPRLHLYDIEDRLLLLVQKKLSNLERDVIFDLGVALRMFTKCIVILRRVEELQLGVESYQKKLNFTKP